MHKFKKLSQELPIEIMSRFGVTISEGSKRTDIETEAAKMTEHVERLSGILAVHLKLYSYSLSIMLSMSKDKDALAVINHTRKQAIALIDAETNLMLDRYVDDLIVTEKRECKHDG